MLGALNHNQYGALLSGGHMINPRANSAELAINGGAPIRSTPMPARMALGPEEAAYIQNALDFYRESKLDPGYQGHFEALYCNSFCDFMGGGYADAVATGTASIYVALAALQLPAGSEVITSSITDPGTLSAIIFAGHTPRLADTKPGSYNMGVEEFVARISPTTRAVVVVHAAGQATEIDEIVAEAHRRDIRVLEDCAQSHGSTWKGAKVGTFGDIAAFSTMYRKAHMTGASGGVVYSRDKDLHHLGLAYADRGKPRWREDFDDRDPSNYLFPALNLHTDEISCAIGCASLGKLPATIAARLNYLKGLDELKSLSNVCVPYGWSKNDSPFYYPILVNEDALNCSKVEFAEAVREEGIGLNPHYMYVVSDWPWVQKYLADDFPCPNARAIRDSSFNLYVNEKYGEPEIRDTLDAIVKVEECFAR
jgi:perosamine synthetase